MKNGKIFLVDIESIPTRYTSQWKIWIPAELKKAGLTVEVIEGTNNSEYKNTSGGFFNFYETNLYKSQQGEKISELFIKEKVKNGDIFFFTDAWHPQVFNLRQMIDISGLDVKIYGMFHAGSYDPYDILGVSSREHFKYMEVGLLDSLDKSFFATNFSKDLMLKNVPCNNEHKKIINEKMIVTGFPYYFNELFTTKKENNILFPHRISPEKNLDLFKKLEKIMPEYNFIVTLEETKNKKEYHELLAKSKYAISFSDQETWGISVFESLYSGCIPIVPDKLSYKEMYTDDIKFNPYNSDGIEDKENWPQKVFNIIKKLEKKTKEEIEYIIDKNINKIENEYCTLNKIIEHITLTV